MNMRIMKAVMMGLLVAISPMLWAQTATDNDEAETKQPKYGIRFVVCTSTEGTLPSPLYTKVDKEYKEITITSRMASQRVTPVGGVVHFYDSMPPTDEKGHITKAAKLTPVMSISIPEPHRAHNAKSICILQPRKKKDTEPDTCFLKETDFKLGGIHIINFTNTPLEMIIDPTGQFDLTKNTVQRAKIGPYIKTQTISKSDSNVWSYTNGKQAKDEDNISFVLQALPPTGRGAARRIRASVMNTSEKSSQISIVVPHPTVKNSYSLLSIQYGDDGMAKPKAKAAH